jgi:atypical dual specificity phosphatase
MEYRRALLNFSFVIPGKLAGMARPGMSGSLSEDIAFLKTEGIGGVISLSETTLDEAALLDCGISYLHVPVDDFTAPTIDQVELCMKFIENLAYERKRAVAIHCGAGCGRTGSMLACHFVHRGKTAELAVEETRILRPCSIETEGQRALVYLYEEYLKYRSSPG